jgi:Lrp/AsnC family transcriptional regulator, leucine-responsive regulatory protein
VKTIDATDTAILSVLQEDGRITNMNLAERVCLSPSACLRRVRRLEDDGVIDRYVALVGSAAVGRPTSVFVEVSLSSQREEVLDAFEEAIKATPEVIECHLMSGDSDYLIKVQCGDVTKYERIHRQYLAVLPGVTRLKTSFSLRTVLASTALELT